MKRFLCAILTISLLAISAPAAHAADAADGDGSSVAVRRGKLIAKSALYGFGGGLVVGLASQVLKRKTKNIFVLGSLGLYAGILLGIYLVSTSSGPAPYEGPDTYEDYSRLRLEPPANGGTILARADAKALRGKARFGSELKLNLLNIEF